MPWWGILLCVTGGILLVLVVVLLVVVLRALMVLGQGMTASSKILAQFRAHLAEIERRLTELDGQIADALEEEECPEEASTKLFVPDAWRQRCTECDAHDAAHFGAQHRFTRVSSGALHHYLRGIPYCSVEVRISVSNNEGEPLNALALRLTQVISGPEVPDAVEQMLQDEDAQQLFCEPDFSFDADQFQAEMRYGDGGKYVRLEHRGVCPDHAHNMTIIVRETPSLQ